MTMTATVSSPLELQPETLAQAYAACERLTATYAKTFYLGTLLMAPAKRRAVWAVYAWCRRTDELVDGPQGQQTSLSTLQAWEQRLECTFAGQPQDLYDLALYAATREFPLEIQPFRDMIAGQRMDLCQRRYRTFAELETYCYRVAGTVGLMSLAIMGTPQQDESVRQAAIALGIANQLTNILRDVGEDWQRGRIYLPLEELTAFSYTVQELKRGVINGAWRRLMQFQIARARDYFRRAEPGVNQLCADARWPVWTALINYRRILDQIERNDYDVFNRRAYVSLPGKLLALPGALWRSFGGGW
ncbi:MAG: phytoene synthase [Gloeomargarita sp. GMQP_bins_120]